MQRKSKNIPYNGEEDYYSANTIHIKIRCELLYLISIFESGKIANQLQP